MTTQSTPPSPYRAVERLRARWYDRKPLRCMLLGHAWGPDYPMLDGTPARKCVRVCGWHQIPSQSQNKHPAP